MSDRFSETKLLKAINCLAAAGATNSQEIIDAINMLPALIAAAIGSGGGATFVNVLVDSPGYELPAPSGVFEDGDQYVWRVVNTNGQIDISLGEGFRIPAGATDPLPFSTAGGMYDYVSARFNSANEWWDIITFIPGYPVTPT